MDNQVIISIGREYGVDAHTVAKHLADKYQLPVYDSKLIEQIAEEKNLNLDNLKKFDEKPKNRLFSRTIDGFSSSPEDTVAQMQFDYLREKASKGESFIVLGRCAESVLKDNPNLISIFLTADMSEKIEVVHRKEGIPKEKCESVIIRNNRKRKAYHNYYCKEKWGDSRNYQLTVRTSEIGTENTAKVIELYVDSRIKASD